MTEAAVLFGLLVLLFLAGLVMALVSGAALGRELGDRAYQQVTGVNGINQIQTLINVRTCFFRVQWGLVFMAVTVLSLIEATSPILSWASRLLFTWALLSHTAGSILDWRDKNLIMSMQIKAQQSTGAEREVLAVEAEGRRVLDVAAEAESYRQIADAAVANLESAANAARESRGDSPMELVPDVLPEHASPVTPQQAATARIATLRARAAAAARSLGCPPIEGPEAP